MTQFIGRYLAGVLLSAGLVFAHTAQAAELSDAELAEKECGACHFYFSYEFLPAFSWKIIIDDLENHFGDDASLDEDSRKRILNYMAQGRSTEIPIRVTTTGWWKRRHGAGLLANNNIKAIDCGACHRGSF